MNCPVCTFLRFARLAADNYDPFGRQQTTTTGVSGGGGGGGGGLGPAVMSPTQEAPPPPYQPTAQQTVTTADFQVPIMEAVMLKQQVFVLYFLLLALILYLTSNSCKTSAVA